MGETGIKSISEFEKMIDEGFINEAENRLLETLDYNEKEEVFAAVLFYEYACEKEEDFLIQNNYSKEEALDGIRELAGKAGYGEISELLMEA